MDNLENDSLWDDHELDRIGEIRELRLRLGLRTMVLLVVVALCSYFVNSSGSDFKYFMNRSWNLQNLLTFWEWGERNWEDMSVLHEEDLGDVRLDPSTRMTIDSKSNTLLSFQNDVTTIDNLRSDQYKFYFSPITSLIVGTARKLPSKAAYELAAPELNPYEARFVIENRAFPADLKVSFDGRGRYYRSGELPSWAGSLIEYFAEQSKIPRNEIGLFLDGEYPDDNWGSLVVMALSFFVALVALVVFGLALRKLLVATK